MTPAVPRTPPLPEREAPLQTAFEVVAQAQRGIGATLLVSGEPDIGESALLRQLLRGLDARQRVLWGGCEDRFSPPL